MTPDEKFAVEVNALEKLIIEEIRLHTQESFVAIAACLQATVNIAIANNKPKITAQKMVDIAGNVLRDPQAASEYKQ